MPPRVTRGFGRGVEDAILPPMTIMSRTPVPTNVPVPTRVPHDALPQIRSPLGVLGDELRLGELFSQESQRRLKHFHVGC